MNLQFCSTHQPNLYLYFYSRFRENGDLPRGVHPGRGERGAVLLPGDVMPSCGGGGLVLHPGRRARRLIRHIS